MEINARIVHFHFSSFFFWYFKLIIKLICIFLNCWRRRTKKKKLSHEHTLIRTVFFSLFLSSLSVRISVTGGRYKKKKTTYFQTKFYSNTVHSFEIILILKFRETSTHTSDNYQIFYNISLLSVWFYYLMLFISWLDIFLKCIPSLWYYYHFQLKTINSISLVQSFTC